MEERNTTTVYNAARTLIQDGGHIPPVTSPRAACKRSIDSCQNKVSADQYHSSESRAQVSAHRGQVFFQVIRQQGTGFQMIAGSSLIFFKKKFI